MVCIIYFKILAKELRNEYMNSADTQFYCMYFNLNDCYMGGNFFKAN